MIIGLRLRIPHQKYKINSPSTMTPTTPTNLQSTAGHLEVLLTWSGASDDSFSIYRSTTDSHSEEVNIVNELTETSYVDYDVQPGINYVYWVKSSLVGNYSDYSNPSESVPYIEIPQSNNANLTSPEGEWTLGTLFYSSSPTPANALVDFEGSNYIFNGTNWTPNPGTGDSDNVVINGSLVAYAPSSGGWRFWDIEAP